MLNAYRMPEPNDGDVAIATRTDRHLGTSPVLLAATQSTCRS